ncbi:MAG: SDR family oxidoreductase [Chlorobi bacterium]|nr:SDR family oxidoreductase [Chlorobiota bacterium]
MASEGSKTIVVTGSTSGIGRAIAFEFGRHGWNVVINGRRQEAIDETVETLEKQGIRAVGVKADVSNEEKAKHLIEEAVKHFGQIDCLVNNAGISMRALFEDAGPEIIRKIMDINFFGTIYCTYYALPHLRKTKGTIVGISSIAGYVGLPARTGYSASKFAMNGYLESLRIELKPTGVNVIIVSPGFTATAIRYRALTEKGTAQETTPIDEKKADRPENVAKAVYEAVIKRKREVILTGEGKLTVLFKKCFPSILERLVFKRFVKEPDSPLKKYL